ERARDAAPATDARDAGPVCGYDAAFRRVGEDRDTQDRVAVARDPDAVFVQARRAHPLREVVERGTRVRHGRRDIVDGLLAHLPELLPLVGIGVAVDGENADLLLPHLRAHFSGRGLELRPFGEEVELPEPLATLFAIAPFGDDPDAERVVLPAPRRERACAVRPRALLHRGEDRVKPRSGAVRRHQVARDARVPLGRALPGVVAVDGKGDRDATDLSDEPLDPYLLLGIAPVVLQRHRIARILGTDRGLHVRDERGIAELRRTHGQVRDPHFPSLPRALSRATIPSCFRYWPTSPRPNFEAPSSRSRNV